MVERKCLVCGKPFLVYPSQPKKFCSHLCSTEDKKTRIERICEHCGGRFETVPNKLKEGKGRFCDKKCYEEHRKALPQTCLYCGETFLVGPTRKRYGNAKFCSDECKRKASRKGVDQTCLTCGKSFYVPLSRIERGGGKYCSVQCRSAGQKKKRATCCCEYCGKEFRRPQTSMEKYNKGRFCSKECQYQWQSENLTGEKAPFWRGGTSFEPYPVTFNRAFKEEIRKRDNYTCAICGKAGICAHHIDYNKQHTVAENCITLCRSCHQKTMNRRTFWTKRLSHHLRAQYADTA